MRSLHLSTYVYRELELDFKEWLAILGYADITVYNIPLFTREFFHWLEANEVQQIKEITAQHVTDFIFQLKKRPHAMTGGKLSSAHINKYHQALTLLSTYVRQTGKGDFTVELQRMEETRKVPEILSKAEVKELYNACDESILGLRDKVMLGIYYGCGLRRNEGVQLDVNDIDLKGRLLYVRKGKNYKERYVPVSDTLLQHIKDYLDHSRPFLMVKNKIPALFISEKGYRAQGQSLLIRLRKLVKEAKLNKTNSIGLHTLRHSIATHLLQSGMKLAGIAKFLGHSSLESTQIYTHINNEGK